MSTNDYIKNERFIHDALIVDASASIAALYEYWKKHSKIEPFLLTWPSELIATPNGPVGDVCRLQLPGDKTRWPTLMRQAVNMTKAYALLFTEQRERDIHVILESPHGSRAWTIPIERHGEIVVLGRPSFKDDVESIGLLWRPDIAKA